VKVKNMALSHLIKKAGGMVKWLDGIPSVPAASGAFVIGLLAPKWVITIVIIGIVIYGVIKYNDR
jgi:hypothetical protein